MPGQHLKIGGFDGASFYSLGGSIPPCAGVFSRALSPGPRLHRSALRLHLLRSGFRRAGASGCGESGGVRRGGRRRRRGDTRLSLSSSIPDSVAPPSRPPCLAREPPHDDNSGGGGGGEIRLTVATQPPRPWQFVRGLSRREPLDGGNTRGRRAQQLPRQRPPSAPLILGAGHVRETAAAGEAGRRRHVPDARAPPCVPARGRAHGGCRRLTQDPSAETPSRASPNEWLPPQGWVCWVRRSDSLATLPLRGAARTGRESVSSRAPVRRLGAPVVGGVRDPRAAGFDIGYRQCGGRSLRASGKPSV